MKTDDETMEFQILRAAETLFMEQGYAKTTMGQIAKLAGCNQALVHYYYRTKDNLFDKIFEEKVRLIATHVLVIEPTEASFEEKVAEMVKRHFDFLKQNPKLASFVLTEIVSKPERLRALADKHLQYPLSIFTRLDAHLKEEIAKGTIRPISSVDLLFTIASLNIAPFLLLPVLQKALDLTDEAIREIIERRRQETVETVLVRLRT